MEALYLILGIATVIAVIVLAYWLNEKKRTDAMGELASTLKFSFSKKEDFSFLKAMHHLHLFSQGHSKKIRNIMKGTASDIAVTIMDYQYTTGGGKSSHTWRQTVIIFQSSLLQLPPFTLRPENLLHKIGAAFGYQDIDFDSHPTFSKRYLLRGDDEDAVRETFNDALLSYYDQSKGLSTEAAGDTLIFYRVSKRVATKDIRSLMEEGFALFSLLKTQSS
jgi:hypothetical protein